MTYISTAEEEKKMRMACFCTSPLRPRTLTLQSRLDHERGRPHHSPASATGCTRGKVAEEEGCGSTVRFGIGPHQLLNRPEKREARPVHRNLRRPSQSVSRGRRTRVHNDEIVLVRDLSGRRTGCMRVFERTLGGGEIVSYGAEKIRPCVCVCICIL